jgi:hypothetical protein
MSSPITYITEFINNYKLNNDGAIDIENFRKELFTKSIMAKCDEKSKLILLYHKYDLPIKSELEKECRSVIIDAETLQVVSYTCNNPIYNKEAQQFIINTTPIDMNIFKCYEGSLLSLFNHNDTWYLSTRRCLDSRDSLWNSKSHYDMFIDVLKKENLTFDEFTNKLNPNYGYYFVLIHHENKQIINYSNIFDIEYSKLCLIFVRDKETQSEIDETLCDYKHIFAPERITMEEFTEENKKLDINIKNEGIIIKLNSGKECILKLQTISYQFSKAMGPDSNIYKGYIYLYQISALKDYIKNYSNHKNYGKIVNPKNSAESYDTIGVIDSMFKVLTSELFELFKLLWDIKKGTKQNEELYKTLPKEYKDILFKLRGIYFKIKSDNISSETKTMFSINYIYLYLKSLDVEHICALLRQRKLMFNWMLLESTNEYLKLFKTISNHCDKMKCKLTAIYINVLFPDILSTEVPLIDKNEK